MIALPSPSGVARMPQPTPQYGQVVRTARDSGVTMFMMLAVPAFALARTAPSCRLPFGQRATEHEVVAEGFDRCT